MKIGFNNYEFNNWLNICFKFCCTVNGIESNSTDRDHCTVAWWGEVTKNCTETAKGVEEEN